MNAPEAGRAAILAGGARTPFCAPGGSLREIDAIELAAQAVSALLNAAGQPPSEITHLFLGLAAGEFHGLRPDRKLCLAAGLRSNVECRCAVQGHGAAIALAAQAARIAEADPAARIVVAATQSASRTPWLAPNLALGQPSPVQMESGLERLLEFDAAADSASAAVDDNMARCLGLGRSDIDFFLLRAFKKAPRQGAGGEADDGLHPLSMSTETHIVEVGADGPPTHGKDLESLSAVPLAMDGGLHSRSAIAPQCDGAAAILVTGADWARSGEAADRIVIRDARFVCREADRPDRAASEAAQKAAARFGVAPKEADGIEIVERSAAFAMGVVSALDLEEHQYNRLGGALAQGMPGAAGGLAALIRLYRNMQSRKSPFGILIGDSGGGEGLAVLLQKTRGGQAQESGAG